MLNVDRATENIFQLPKSCMELCISTYIYADSTNSGNVPLQSPVALQTTLKADLTNEKNVQDNGLNIPRRCRSFPLKSGVNRNYVYVYSFPSSQRA